MKPLLLPLILVVTAFVPAVTGAQTCVLDDTLAQCKAKIAQLATEQAADTATFRTRVTEHVAEAKVATDEELKTMNTGTSVATTAGAGNTINDFISLLNVSASSGGVSDAEEELAFELNRFLGIPTDAGYKIDATVHHAKVFDPLEASLVTAGEAALLDDFRKQLGDSDDVELGFTYSPMTERLGRSDHQLHKKIFLELFAASTTVANAALKSTAGELTAFERQLGDQIAARRKQLADQGADATVCPAVAEADPFGSVLNEGGLTFRRIANCLGNDARANEYVSLLVRDRTNEFDNLRLLQAELAKNQFFRFAELVSNQPQAYARAVVRSRDDLVGPGETSLKLTYEKGWVNVNSFQDYMKDSCARLESYACLTNYLTPKRLATLQSGDRIALSLEYTKKDEYNFQPRANLPVINVDSAHSVIASFSYGRYLQIAARGNPQSRLDLSLTYEDVSDDEARQSRGLMNITYSQRISDSFVLALSAIYANKPEFRGDVDEEVSVNLGLNYKLSRAGEF